ncbi:MAG TPA: pyruvate synthase subunit PorB [Syntrophorhabdaceae bacterium]|nr:pyruvate synthase subunit PorB [Syntrophorhabdaceae bacterium]HOL06362.1 pyruvate synthase subunit PorB [Syntrophorhabdaceae bacterium]HPP42335.1 pyruvate synthase subunit PorB [Syntrophorhabdaceae bacterium]
MNFPELDIYAANTLPKEEFAVQGHRACQGCAEILGLRIALKALGRNTIIVMATGCMEIISTPLPITDWRLPWIHVAFENAAAVASGVESALKILVDKGRIPKKDIHVIAVAGDGGTSDIGLQALSGALERGHKFTYICLDNEAYMNTGIQRSSSTPYGAMTTTSPPGKKSIGQSTWKKNMPKIAAAHNIPYVATACPSYPFDLFAKIKKARTVNGPSYIHMLSVCPTGWRIPTDASIKYGRLAVETGIFPLYEIENGKYRLTFNPEPLKQVIDYLSGQGRFRHLTVKTIATIQEHVKLDWKRLKYMCGIK